MKGGRSILRLPRPVATVCSGSLTSVEVLQVSLLFYGTTHYSRMPRFAKIKEENKKNSRGNHAADRCILGKLISCLCVVLLCVRIWIVWNIVCYGRVSVRRSFCLSRCQSSKVQLTGQSAKLHEVFRMRMRSKCESAVEKPVTAGLL